VLFTPCGEVSPPVPPKRAYLDFIEFLSLFLYFLKLRAYCYSINSLFLYMGASYIIYLKVLIMVFLNIYSLCAVPRLSMSDYNAQELLS
jgi:hypothetical protein